MSVVFSVSALLADLRGFSKSISKFMATRGRLDQLETQLSVAVANAKLGTGAVVWSTTEGCETLPIRTRPSKSYRGYGRGTKKIYGEITFDFEGELDSKDSDRLVITAGATHIKLIWEDSTKASEYHFDIHPKKAGHPMLHFQFDGAVNEVPRLLSLFAHPLDVLELTLMEIFQDEWKHSRVGLTCLQNLHLFPMIQRKRMLEIMKEYAALLDDGREVAPLASLQNTPASPLELYPA